MIKSLYHVFKVKNHEEIKNNILTYIANRNKTPSHDGTYISNTDYLYGSFPHLGDFHYIDFLLEKNQKELNEFYQRKFIKNKQYLLTNAWFNQYYSFSGSEHKLHDHPNSDITNIYYLELKDKKLITNLMHPQTNKIIVPRVSEGCILSFSSKILHFSPKNYTNSRKTVVSFNVDIK